MGNFKKRQYFHISFIFVYNKLRMGTNKIKKKYLCTRTYSRNITHSLQILKLRLAYLIACHCMLQCLLNYHVLLENLFPFWCHFSTCPFSWTGVTLLAFACFGRSILGANTPVRVFQTTHIDKESVVLIQVL